MEHACFAVTAESCPARALEMVDRKLASVHSDEPSRPCLFLPEQQNPATHVANGGEPSCCPAAKLGQGEHLSACNGFYPKPTVFKIKIAPCPISGFPLYPPSLVLIVSWTSSKREPSSRSLYHHLVNRHIHHLLHMAVYQAFLAKRGSFSGVESLNPWILVD